jgi:hypothetical protein
VVALKKASRKGEKDAKKILLMKVFFASLAALREIW